MVTNENKCILKHNCKNAGVVGKCSVICPYFISLHGYSGKGGRLAEANIPRDYQKITIENNPVRREQPEVFERIDMWSKSFPRIFEEDGERIRSLYLFSPETGTGKTTTACAIANSFLIYYFIECMKRGIQPVDKVVFYLDFNSFQLASNEANHPFSIPEERQRAKAIVTKSRITALNVPLLVVDDIGMRKPTDAFGSLVHDVINHRVTNRLPIVFTSNVPMEDLASCYDKRLFDRIRDQNNALFFQGESKRGLRKDFN